MFKTKEDVERMLAKLGGKKREDGIWLLPKRQHRHGADVETANPGSFQIMQHSSGFYFADLL